jgi:hypothetical protein
VKPTAGPATAPTAPSSALAIAVEHRNADRFYLSSSANLLGSGRTTRRPPQSDLSTPSRPPPNKTHAASSPSCRQARIRFHTKRTTIHHLCCTILEFMI